VAFRPDRIFPEIAMPLLDSTALESDPEGLAFLRSVLKPSPERRRPWLPLRSPVEPFPQVIDTTVEIIVEAAEEQSLVPAAPARA
jgi:hypothetical protein